MLCKNCDQPLVGNFCSSCGQPASTHRFSIKLILSHDFLHGIFHLDHGFLYTIKELFTRPGHSIREYIEGQRVQHFKYFTLLVILIIGLSTLEHLTDFHYADLGESTVETEAIDKFRSEHPKILLIGIIPFVAIFSYVFFRKAKLNYAEHFVLNAYKASAQIIITALFVSTKLFIENHTFLKNANYATNILIIGYTVLFYYQYFSVFYKRKGLLLLRSILCTTTTYLLLILTIAVFVILNQQR